jgi:hypothetical protein
LDIKLFLIERPVSNGGPSYWTCSTRHGSGWSPRPKQAFSPSELTAEIRRLIDDGCLGDGDCIRTLHLKERSIPESREESPWHVPEPGEENTFVLAVARAAAAEFGGAEDDGVFSTANFQAEVKRRMGQAIDGRTVAATLRNHPSIVPLAGGCHWMILPGDLKRELFAAVGSPPVSETPSE